MTNCESCRGRKEALSVTNAHLNLLVDTNTWMDYFLGRRGAEDAAAVIQCSLDHEDALAVTPGTLKEVFYLVGSTIKKRTRMEEGDVSEESALVANEASWACLSQIQGLAAVLNLGFGEHLEASVLRSKNPDYEDNLLLAVAKIAKVDYIITKDKGLLANDVVPALTPAEYVAMRG